MSFEQKELRIFLNVVCYIYISVITYHIYRISSSSPFRGNGTAEPRLLIPFAHD
jgi:glycopeptide antibiotics resistance protein